MADHASVSILDKVRRALGRTRPLSAAPTPPEIDEPITRLVHTDIGLPQLFARKAQSNAMLVDLVYPEELAGRVVEFLRSRECRKVALPQSRLLERLQIPAALREAGFEVRQWGELTLDELYDFDCGVTDVYCAVAEIGGLVMRESPEHGRALSLIPPIHVAILEPADFVPDLVDLCEKLAREGVGSGTAIITGPSKTADIEMNIVQGVHGPKTVQLFVLQ